MGKVERLDKFVDDGVEIGRGVHIGTAMNRSFSLLQFPSFSCVFRKWKKTVVWSVWMKWIRVVLLRWKVDEGESWIVMWLVMP